jgi:hypothetical protein
MNSFNLYSFKFLSEDERENLSNALELSIHPYSANFLKSHYLRFVRMGRELHLIGNRDKGHLLKSFDFPIDLYFELKLLNEELIKTHRIDSGMRKAGYFYDMTQISDSSYIQPVDEAQYDDFVFTDTPCNKLMHSGVYSIYNSSHKKIVDIEFPYSGQFMAYLDEQFGSYYLTSDETGEITTFKYLPRLTANSMGLVKVRLKDYTEMYNKKISFKIFSREIQLRYLFVFNNDPGEFELNVANKKGPLDFSFMGKEQLLNGKEAYRYHIQSNMKLTEIFGESPMIASFKSTKNNSPIQGYVLPERLYLPLVSSRSIKADKENYYAEIFVNI